MIFNHLGFLDRAHRLRQPGKPSEKQPRRPAEPVASSSDLPINSRTHRLSAPESSSIANPAPPDPSTGASPGFSKHQQELNPSDQARPGLVTSESEPHSDIDSDCSWAHSAYSLQMRKANRRKKSDSFIRRSPSPKAVSSTPQSADAEKEPSPSLDQATEVSARITEEACKTKKIGHNQTPHPADTIHQDRDHQSLEPHMTQSFDSSIARITEHLSPLNNTPSNFSSHFHHDTASPINRTLQSSRMIQQGFPDCPSTVEAISLGNEASLLDDRDLSEARTNSLEEYDLDPRNTHRETCVEDCAKLADLGSEWLNSEDNPALTDQEYLRISNEEYQDEVEPGQQSWDPSIPTDRCSVDFFDWLQNDELSATVDQVASQTHPSYHVQIQNDQKGVFDDSDSLIDYDFLQPYDHRPSGAFETPQMPRDDDDDCHNYPGHDGVHSQDISQEDLSYYNGLYGSQYGHPIVEECMFEQPDEAHIQQGFYDYYTEYSTDFES